MSLVKLLSFLKFSILYSLERCWHCFLSFGGSQSFPPTQIYLPKAFAEHSGWKYGSKSKKQRASDVPWFGRSYRVIVEYFLGSETFLPKTGGHIFSHNHKLGALCLLNHSKRLKNVASNLHYTMQKIKCQTKWSRKRLPKSNPISQVAKWGLKK